MYIQTQIPAYKTAQMADRQSGRYIHVHTSTNPCLQDRSDGRSPVRVIHTYKHKSLPTRPHRWQVAGQGDTYMYIQTQIPAYKTAQMADRRSGRYILTCTNTNPYLQDRTDGRSPVREIHTYMYKHKSLPTKPHRWQVAGQGDTYIQTQIPAYKTAQMADRRSGRYIHVHTNTNSCLQDRTDGRSPVREIHTYKHKSLPTRPHRWQIAGQGDTYIQTQIPAYKTAQMADRRSGRYIHVHTNTNSCLQDRTDGRSPVREIHTYKHKSLPTRPHRWQIAGQGDTYIQTQIPAYKTAQMADRRSGRYIHVHTNTNPCLQDRTDGRSPVREIHTCTYKHKSLPTRPHRQQVAGQGDTMYMYIHTCTNTNSCLQDRTDSRSPVREEHNYIHVHAQYMNPQLQDHIDNRSIFRQTHNNQLPRKRQPPLDLMIGCTS